MSSTAKDLIKNIDLNGKIEIVTFDHSKLGLEKIAKLAEAGALVIVVVRDMDKAKINLASSKPRNRISCIGRPGIGRGIF